MGRRFRSELQDTLEFDIKYTSFRTQFAQCLPCGAVTMGIWTDSVQSFRQGDLGLDGPITTELSPLEEFSGFYPSHEFIFGDKMILSPILFARSRMTGRMGDGEAECVCMVREEGGEEGRFPGAGRPANHQGLNKSKE